MNETMFEKKICKKFYERSITFCSFNMYLVTHNFLSILHSQFRLVINFSSYVYARACFSGDNNKKSTWQPTNSTKSKVIFYILTTAQRLSTTYIYKRAKITVKKEAMSVRS